MRWKTSMAAAGLLLIVADARAASLGDRMDVLTGRHGAPVELQNSGNRLIYRWKDWELTVDFAKGMAERMKYVKTGTIIPEDIMGVFSANGDLREWKRSSGLPVNWLRPDGARLSLHPPNTILVESASLVEQQPKPVVPAVKLTPVPAVPAMQPARHSAERPASDAAKGFAILLVIGLITVAVGPERLRRLLASALKSEGKVGDQSGASVPSLHFSEKRTIDDLDWDEFELLVSELYRRRGFDVEFAAATGPDDGVDVILRRGEECVLVQCKHWKAWKVGVKELREFFGVLVADGATRGMFVTSKSFTREAVDFANGKPIELVSGGDLRALLDEAGLLSNGQLQQFDEWVPALLKHATIPVPSCPNCGKTMNRKKSKRGTFWGCSGFPHCCGKRDARRHLDASLAGV